MPGTRGAVPVPLKANGQDLTQQVLDALADKDNFKTDEQFPEVAQAEIKAALDRLRSRLMVDYDTQAQEKASLTQEGQTIAEQGSHEYKVWEAVTSKGKVAIRELASVVGAESAKIGQGNAIKLKWVKKDGDSLVPLETSTKDTAREQLQEIKSTGALADQKVLADLKKRKLITIGKVITYSVRKGPKYAREIIQEVTDLTADMLANGSWQTANFKPYNFNALGASQNSGALHPLMKVRQEFRAIFFNQGFVEMPTGRFVESGFWNFDALYVPQQHPARDVQDTFFISDPPKADRPRDAPEFEQAMDQMEGGARLLYAPKEASKPKSRDYERYWTDVIRVHEGAKDGEDAPFDSRGYRYPWSADECLRLVLRTHTTAVSAWCLHRLAEDPRPARYFSIDRVFRNEAVDATHLAEFHQVEGVIADFNLTLGGLMRFMEDFFGKMGLTNLRFKPAYNPYTEPSMEIFGHHSGLGKWVEIGNSGMFRPEMLEPMGLPKDLRVYGFGLSLERPTMIKYGVTNIRDLLGHKVDLGFIESNAAVRLDKN